MNELKKAIQDSGLKNKKIAELLNMNPQSFSRIINEYPEYQFNVSDLKILSGILPVRFIIEKSEFKTLIINERE